MTAALRSLYTKPTIMRSLTWGLVLTVIIVMAVFNVFFYFRSANQIENDLQKQAVDTAERLAGVLGTPLWNLDEQTVERTAQVYSHLEDVAYLNVQDDQGNVVYAYEKDTSGAGVINRSENIYFEDRLVGRVEVSISKHSLEQEQQNSLVSTLLSTTIIVMTIVVANQFLLRRFLHTPLTELTRGLDSLAQGQYEHRLAPFRQTDIDAIAQSVNGMAGQIAERDHRLRELIDTLEDRVTARTRDLRVASDVSRQVTTVLKLDTLLSHIAELTQQSFGFYQVLVFLLDEVQSVLQLRAAAGAVDVNIFGALSHISLDQKPGIIAAAGREQKLQVSNNVLADPDFQPHPNLPDTRSEAALPILFGGKLVGVLDLQAQNLDRFSQGDLEVLQTLAEQIAIAVRNANLYEDALDARTRAERADKVKSQFLASVSHELRTPLNAIINFTMFVTRGKMGPITDKQTEALTKVVNSARHLLNLINDVLDMSKIEAGSLELYVEDGIDLNVELPALIATAQQLLEDKPVTILPEIETDLPPLTGDRQRINQIMLNLVSNACKFTEEGHITIGARHQDGEILLFVKDTGPGIAPEDHEAIFESFRQTEAGLRQGKGTGLGLPISRRLAEAHGGRIWLESARHQGATFYVALPIKPEHLVPTQTP